ncbi:MAG: Re/Si-specific NAD(P)(+) transhydrogenase subunit alpha [Planctomycetota bacterium]|jgi:NAD(P) transhydrogenase subunit alpha
MLRAFIPKEAAEGETRVAATPETVKHMIRAGLEVSVQAGAGAASGIPDEAYEEAGAKMVPEAAYDEADLVLLLNPPDAGVARKLKEGACLVSFLYPLLNQEAVRALRDGKVSAFAMDLIPRISRAQKMDALSSQSNIAGYKAVIMAADALLKLFPLLMTAAGTIKPARVVILGAGVAGLQALATAKRLGAVVEVSDIRPAVKEQVESLGGRFIDIPVPEEAEDAGGYAKDLGEEFLRRQREILTEHISAADAVITTALIPGKPAPLLLTEEMTKAMKPGSVVVDLAAVMGGNCALTKPGETVVVDGVKIIGERNVPGLVPYHSSDMYARNVLTVVQHLLTEGALELDFEDEITAGSFVTHAGKVRHGPTAEALGDAVEEPARPGDDYEEPPAEEGEEAPDEEGEEDDEEASGVDDALALFDEADTPDDDDDDTPRDGGE